MEDSDPTTANPSIDDFSGRSRRIGAAWNGTEEGDPFSGYIDEVRIYSRALSPAEVAALYNWAPGPVAHWKLDENSGASALDASGNGLSASLSGNSSWDTGKFGAGVKLDGTDAYLVKADHSALDLTDNWTIMGWFNDQNTTLNHSTQYLITKGNVFGESEVPYYMSIGTNTVKAGVIASWTDQSTQASIDSTTSINRWTHYAATFDNPSNTINIYVNGILHNTSATITNTAAANATALEIGRRTVGDSYFRGQTDDIRIYNYARISGQIIEDMNGGHPVGGSPVGSQVGYWKLNEGYGTTAHDESINANDLTLSSARWTKNGKFDMGWDGSGSGYRLSRTDDPDFDFLSSENFSISIWFKSDNAVNPSGNQFLIDKEAGTGYGIYADTAGKINFGIDSDGAWSPADSAQSVSDIYDNTWHYIAAIKTGTSKIELYVDGKLNGSDSSISASGDLTNADSLTVGDQDTSNGNEFAGDIDELKIYRAALTPEQILIDYNQGQATVMGALSTDSSGNPSYSSDSSYCVPGDTGSCDPPIGEWKLDEKNGTTANDTSANGTSGSFTGVSSSSWRAGKFGSAIEMDGSSDYINASNTSLFDFGTATAFSTSLWLKLSDNGSDNQEFIQNMGGTDYFEVYHRGTTGKLRGELGSGGNLCIIEGSTNLEDNAWHNVYAVFKRNASCTVNDILLYVDGKPEASTVNTATLNTNAANIDADGIRIGDNAGATTTSIKGLVDMVLIYNYARTPAQIAWEYNHGEPLAHYRFDECQGTTVFDSSPNYNDSATGNNGTMNIGASGSNTTAGTCTGSAGEAWKDGANGKIGSSIEFDGSDDYVTVTDPSNGKLDFGTGPFTIQAWIKPQANADTNVIIDKKNGTSAAVAGYFLRLTPANFILSYIGNGSATQNCTNSTAVNDDVWTHVAATLERGTGSDTFKYYINGTLDKICSYTSGYNIDSSIDFNIGRQSNNTNFFQGQLDDVRVYNYALTQPQIKTVYNGGSAVRFAPITGSP